MNSLLVVERDSVIPRLGWRDSYIAAHGGCQLNDGALDDKPPTGEDHELVQQRGAYLAISHSGAVPIRGDSKDAIVVALFGFWLDSDTSDLDENADPDSLDDDCDCPS